MGTPVNLYKKVDGINYPIDPTTTIEQIAGLADRLAKCVEKVDGKGLSTNDLTNVLLTKLNGLENYDDTALSNSIAAVNTRLDTLVNGSASTAIDTFNEIVAFLKTIDETTTLEGIVAGINTTISNESSRAIAAENALQQNINTEKSSRESADTTLQNNINAESTSRQNADTTLQTNITNEVNRAKLAEVNLCNDINVDKVYPIGSGYYTLATAIAAINDSTIKKSGISITFASASGIYDKYYFIGTVAQWSDTTLWINAKENPSIRYAKNNTGATVAKGKLVYINGSIGENPLFNLATNTDYNIASRTWGMTYESITNNSVGKIIHFGLIENIDTSAFTAGTELWLGVNGAYTSTRPASPITQVYIGMVIRSSATIGSIYVDFRHIPNFNHLSDVSNETYTDGDSPVFNGTNNRFEKKNLVSSINSNTADIAELKLGSGYYCMAGWNPNDLSPTPTVTKGNLPWLRDISHVYLCDMTQNTVTPMRPIGELQRANWLRYIDSTFAPTIGITEAMRATCDVALYLDAAHTNLYSAAGAFNATTFYNTYGMSQKLYDASGNEVRILRPWETTSTNYNIGIGFSEKVWLIDGLGTSGVYWSGLSQHEITWDGVKGVALERTAICPGPVTTFGGKTRSFFYLYNTGDSNTVSSIGKNNICTLFSGLGRTFPRVNDMQQITNMTYARANNSVATNPYPVAEGGYHALNAAITRREVLFGTRYLHNPSLFGSGISSNDTCNNEATFLANGGFKYKVSTDTTWSYCGFGSNPAIYYNASAGITNASDLLNQQYPKEQCLESQMAASFAKETGVSANTDFNFYGSTYQYRNVTGVLGLADGRMNVIVTKVISQTISAFNVSGVATSFDIAVCLRMSLCDGINGSGDIFMYQGGGYEQVGTCISTVQPHTGDTVDLYLQPDQKSWTNTTDITKNNLGAFDFEKSYTKIGTVTNLGDNYAKTRQSLTPWKTVNGGGLSTGQCYYQWDNNYWSTTLQQRVRIAARFRGASIFGFCSPRLMHAYAAVTYADRSIGGSAQILIG